MLIRTQNKLILQGTVSIIVGWWINWVVNQEPKMVEMLLRSCYKGVNEHEPKSEIWVRMGGLGWDVCFSIFWCKSAKMAINFAGMLLEDQKMSIAKDN